MIFKLLKLLAIITALQSLWLVMSGFASETLEDLPSIRCAGETVSTGDRSYRVLEACGPPRKINISGGGSVEEWVYNFGSTKFIYCVTFKNGRLVRIQAGEYGF